MLFVRLTWATNARRGDAQIISKDDNRWWQARKDGAGELAPAGLVPSPELQEYRIACSTVEKSKREQGESMGAPAPRRQVASAANNRRDRCRRGPRLPSGATHV